MANTWPQRALGPWARAKKKGGAAVTQQSIPYPPEGGPPFFLLTRAHGPKLGPKAPKGSGPALGPPVAMYFHKKGIEIK